MSIEKTITEDNWEDGEQPETTQLVMNQKIHEKCNSVEELLNVCSSYGLPDDISKWGVIDNRLTCNLLEDDDSNEITNENSSLFQEFKSGKINLWSCDYDVYIELITPDNMLIENPTQEQLSQATGIQEY